MSNLSSIFPLSLRQPELVPRSDPQHVLQNAPAQPATQMHHLEARISALETIVAAQLSQINTLRIDLDSMKRQRLPEPLHQQSANPQSATSMSMSRNWRAARGKYCGFRWIAPVYAKSVAVWLTCNMQALTRNPSPHRHGMKCNTYLQSGPPGHQTHRLSLLAPCRISNKYATESRGT